MKNVLAFSEMRPVFFLFGIVFGFLMSRAGATTRDFYAELFLFKDFQLLLVMTGAVVVGVIGIQLLRLTGAKGLATGACLNTEGKSKTKHAYAGAMLFGTGWALSGACPGTLPSMLGEGQLSAIPVILGIIFGTLLYGKIFEK